MTAIKYASLPPVSRDFLLDFDSRVLALGGPVGTGKTFVGALRLLLAATCIKPMADGVRRSRFIVVRRRYGDLAASIASDLENLVAPGIFRLTGKQSPMYGELKFEDQHGRVESEVWMYAFETEADVSKIKSLKFTAGMIVEGQELVSRKLIKGIFERLGRFPTPPDVDELTDNEINPAIEWQLPNGDVRHGPWLSLDFNYPDNMHWLKKYLVDDNTIMGNGRALRTLYRQPATHVWVGGIRLSDVDYIGVEGRYKGELGVFVRNPEALPYIKHNGWAYWENILQETMGDDAMIQQNILGDFGDNISGKPVYPRFSREAHVANRPISYMPGLPVWVGVDNGFNNAWIFCQESRDGNLYVIHEIVNAGSDAKTIKAAIEDDVHPYINNTLAEYRVCMVLDQAFWNREGGEGRQQVELLSNAGFRVEKCPFKFTTPIREATSRYIDTRRLQISPTCLKLIDALAGGFHYPYNKSTGQFRDEPNQISEHSHPANAFEFVCARLARHTMDKRSGAKSKKSFDFI